MMRSEVLLLLSLLVLASPSDGGAVEDSNEVGAEERLENLRQAVRSRVQDPILVEAKSFRLYFDRRDPTFRLEDQGTRRNWHLALDRRGFASLIVPNEDGSTTELPVDGMEDLKVGPDSVGFKGRSSAGNLPSVRFTLSVTSPLVGLEIRAELDRQDLERGVRLKLLDRALWISDADSGGVLLPAGLGEWRAAKDETAFRRRFVDTANEAADNAGHADNAERSEGSSPPSLNGIGLLRNNSGLLVVWDRPGIETEVVRREVADDNFPGRRAVETSVTATGASASIRLYPLGRIERRELISSYRQIVNYPKRIPTLRAKAHDAKKIESLIGAAVFRTRLNRFAETDGENQQKRTLPTFSEVAHAAEKIRSRLEIDRALFLLDGWLKPTATELEVSPEAGGEQGLADCSDKLHQQGHLLGLELLTSSENIDSQVEWQEELVEFGQSVEPDLLLIRWPENSGPEERQQLLSGLSHSLPSVLLGSRYYEEAQIRTCSYLEGPLDEKILGLDGDNFFPFFLAVYGRNSRFAVSRQHTLTAGEPQKLLSYLLMAEVPLYPLELTAEATGASGDEGDEIDMNDGSRFPFSRADGGWYEGKDFTGAERFVKTTYEVLTYLARLRARNTIYSYEKLTDDGTVEEIHYGFDLRVVVNRGEKDYENKNDGFVLPKYGFWIQHPFFLAFHATRAYGVSYETPTLFTVRSLEGKLWLKAEKVRIWHGFGPSKIRLGGKTFDVPAEKETKIW